VNSEAIDRHHLQIAILSCQSASQDGVMTTLQPGPTRIGPVARTIGRLPPTSYFLTSAVFHYLGPSLAVLLFVHVGALGVAWLRIASAALLLGLWRRPWRLFARLDGRQRLLLLALGAVLATMNSLFYLAVARLPLATVGAVEFLGTILLAALGVRSRRNLIALAVTVGGVATLTEVRVGGSGLGFLFAFGNCALFLLYVVLAARIATADRTDGKPGPGAATGGIDRLAAAMVIAAVAATPVGLPAALPAFGHPWWLLWGAGVGVCSSVIPYLTDQLALARLPRATFALLLALLPAAAAVLGLIILHQVPTPAELAGIGLVVGGILLHRERR
jgi:inner membrane transporter RhtA